MPKLAKEYKSACLDLLVMLQGGFCLWCERPLAIEGEGIDIDHITPLSMGGTWHGSNLQAIHASCHIAKSAKESGVRNRARAEARRLARATV